jgi:hypothetical protein
VASRALDDATQALAAGRHELEMARRWPEALLLRRLNGLRGLYGAVHRRILRRHP